MGEDEAGFLSIGDSLVATAEALCDLPTSPTIVDVGSGYGRVAHALWRRGFNGRYLGVDILKKHVEWCQEHLSTPTDGILAFEHLDVRNVRYNPNGGIPADQVSLPCATDSADLVHATSVFTHMFSNEVDRYLGEMSRVVRPRGAILVTFFLLDAEARAGEQAGRSRYPMRHRVDEATHTFDPEQPLNAIGYDPAWVFEAAARHGLTVAEVLPGTWCGRASADRPYQDVVVFRPSLSDALATDWTGRDPGTQPSPPIFCPACATWSATPRQDRAGRLRGCPECSSLGRHRVLGVLLPALAGQLRPDPLVLDVAPSRALDGLLSGLGRVVRIDFDPGADGRLVDVRASLTALPLPGGSVDLLVCSHVLEHVPDDRHAMRELARVLAPGGVGVVLVPWRNGPTDEDPSAPEEERVRRFGQADHVRYYGDDFTDRLGEAGLTWVELTAGELLTEDERSMIRAVAGEQMWLVRRSEGGSPPPSVASIIEAMRSALLARVTTAATRGFTEPPPEDPTAVLRERIGRLERDAAQAAAEAEHWRKAYRRLRSRLPVRALAVVGRGARRLRAAVLGGSGSSERGVTR